MLLSHLEDTISRHLLIISDIHVTTHRFLEWDGFL